MTIQIIKTTKKELKQIREENKRIIVRGTKEHYKAGNIINFMACEDGVSEEPDNTPYRINTVLTWNSAPIEKGYQIIGFEEAI